MDQTVSTGEGADALMGKVTKLRDNNRLGKEYSRNGFALLADWVPQPILRGFIAKMQVDFRRSGVELETLTKPGPLLKRDAIEVYGYQYAPMATFLWGMTPAIEQLLGVHLLPTYCYFRLYREGDVCRIHSDRYACEHSLSLTLATSEGKPWPLEVGARPVDKPFARADNAFAADEPFVSVPMSAGDAVLYQGVHRHHGRSQGSPNRWSAHLFMHWVDANGPYADQAFDKQLPPETVDFSL